jgi:serine/threonine protein kinase
MTPARWRQVEEIFLAAAERPPEEREVFLTQVCGGDDELRTEVGSLLAHEIEEEYFESAVEGGAKVFARAAVEEVVGRRIGPYRVTGLVGQGGMGAVYSAVRDDDQFQQQVAIKIVKRGMDTSLVLRRFWRERQILANLSHPNIARLLDGGTTDDGLPYFVMEFIEGRPITEYCEANQLSIQDRLRLFRQVCAAVQSAHQNLVVHRDIKPSNILVTEANGTKLPKLLDFGIAKLVTPETAQAATRTVTSLRMMTPDYASPEQVRGMSITTAADIYSLGAVLYELLTGQRAHRFKTYSPSEIEQTVCNTEAERPSDAAAHATGGPVRWRKQLAGDLDNIVLMALRKEPERRYASVEQFSEDLRRYLAGLPVLARKDTARYRAGKFIRRHKWGLAATAVVILSLVGGGVASVYQTRRAERRFQQVRKLANTFLFDFHDKIQKLSGSTEAREMVVKTALEYLDSLAAESDDDPALVWELATAYQKVGDVQGDPWAPSLGHSEQAMKSYEKSLALAESLATGGNDDLKVQRLLAMSYFKVGTLRAETGDKENAFGLLRKSVGIAEAVARRSDERRDGAYLSDCYVRLGDVFLDTGDAKSGLEFYRRSLEVSKHWAQRLKEDNVIFSVGIDHGHIGEASASLGDLTAAIENYRRGADIFEEVINRNPNNVNYRRTLRVEYGWLGNLYGNPRFVNAGDKVTAEKYCRKALAITEELAAADPKNAMVRIDLVNNYNALGDLLVESDPAQSALYRRKALALLDSLLAGAPNEFRFLSRRSTSLRGLALSLRKLNNRDDALQNLREALEISRQLSAQYSSNPQAQTSLHAALLALADALAETGEHSAALPHYREALRLAEGGAAKARSDVYARWRLADSYAGLGKLYEAMAADAKALAEQRRTHRDEACLWRRKALEVWDGWTQYGVSSVFNTTKREQAAQALSRCEAASIAFRAARPR